MKPKPWSKRWERPNFNIKGIRFDLALTEEQMKEAQKWSKPWLEFDMMREYDTSKIEAALWEEIEASKKSWSWDWWMAQEVNMFAAQASWPEFDSGAEGGRRVLTPKVALWLLHAHPCICGLQCLWCIGSKDLVWKPLSLLCKNTVIKNDFGTYRKVCTSVYSSNKRTHLMFIPFL